MSAAELLDIKKIPGFETYGVSNWGQIYNLETDRMMTLTPNQNGDLSVGLVKNGVQYRRSVKVLVAEAFVDGQTAVANTPIQLDNDKENLTPENICWRPRWFAWQYSHQFEEPKEWFFNIRIADVDTGVEYDSILICAMINGLLCDDIMSHIHVGKWIYPTNQRFVVI